MTRPRKYLSLIAAVLLIALLFLPACNSAQVAEFRDGLQTARDASAQLDTQIAEGNAIIQAMPEGDDRDDMIAAVEVLAERKAQVDKTADDFLAKIAEADNGWDLAAAGAKTAAPLLPPPIGTYVGLAGVLLAGVAEALRRRTKNAAHDVVISIEQTKASNGGTVNFDDPAVKSELRSRMSTNARKLVASAQDKAGPVLIGMPLETATLQK